MLIASGPSEYAPFLRAWKDFKDNIRGIIKYQPGWAEVMPGWRNGDMQAWCRLDDKEDAESAYSMNPFNGTSLTNAKSALRLLHPMPGGIGPPLQDIPH